MIRLCVFVLLAAGASPAQAGAPNADADAIRAADAAWFAAELRRDVEAIMPFVADAAVFQPPDTPAFVGSDAVRKFYRAFFELPFTDVGGSSDSIIVASSGDLAYDVGRNYVVLRGPEGQRRYEGKYLAVWRKTGTSWKVTAISWSLDAPMR